MHFGSLGPGARKPSNWGPGWTGMNKQGSGVCPAEQRLHLLALQPLSKQTGAGYS